MSTTKLDELMAGQPGYDKVPDVVKIAALAQSLMPDSEGRWPGTEGYETTHDVFYAAIMVVLYLKAQPFVTSAGSEGTSVAVKAPDWDSLLAFYRSSSPVIQASGNDVLQVVAIPDPPHVRKVPMNDKGGYYGDINTSVG